MKLLILSFLAIAVLASATSRDCSWRWRTASRDRAMEARHRAMEARESARDRARESRQRQRDDLRAWREAAREQRDRVREQIRDDMRDLRHDWGSTY